jgi:hypothetical protein
MRREDRSRRVPRRFGKEKYDVNRYYDDGLRF